MQATDTINPEDAILACVRKLRAQLGYGVAPIDVWGAAANLGIKVRSQTLDNAGYILSHTNGEFEIRLDAKMSIERQRFTLAHELGHFLFFKHVPHVMSGLTVEDEDQEEERLCNLAASEMLMPLTLVINELDARGFGPKTIYKIADRFGVTWSAALYRLWRALIAISGVNCQLVIWTLGYDDEFYPETRWPDTNLGPVTWSRTNVIGRAFEEKRLVREIEPICIDYNRSEREIAAWRMGRQERVLSLIWAPQDAENLVRLLDPNMTEAQKAASEQLARKNIEKIKSLLKDVDQKTVS